MKTQDRRDDFAIKIFAALITTKNLSINDAVKMSYEIADQMIKESEK